MEFAGAGKLAEEMTLLLTSCLCHDNIDTQNTIMLVKHFQCCSRLAFQPAALDRLLCHRTMATIRSSLPHEDRTAAEPRQNSIEPVILSHIRQVNDNIRLLRLNAVDPNHSIKVNLQPNDHCTCAD